MKPKILFLLLLALVFSVGVAGGAGNPPEWYLQLSQKKGEIVGYGSGKTLEEAVAKAKRDIAQSIRTRVRSRSSIEQKQANDTYSQKVETVLHEDTDVVLSDVSTLRQSKKESLWYVALKMVNLPFTKRFARKIGPFSCTSMKQNRYLADTPLVKALNYELSCELDVRLIRNHGLWYLSYRYTQISLGPHDLERLFVQHESEDIVLKASSSDLREGDRFTFFLTPSLDGFISLLNVYASGEVFVLESNRTVRKGKSFVFPDPSGETELVAGLWKKGQSTHDLYVALAGPQRIDLSRIQTASDDVLKEERHYKFDELLDLLDRHAFSSVIVRTRPR